VLDPFWQGLVVDQKNMSGLIFMDLELLGALLNNLYSICLGYTLVCMGRLASMCRVVCVDFS
jgi:hypothetical protein